jgi:ABC-2 type transport system ATP-binding protein
VSSSSITVKSQLIKKKNLISTDKEQVIEVEFDYKIEEQAIAKIENLISCKNTHDMIWELTF